MGSKFLYLVMSISFVSLFATMADATLDIGVNYGMRGDDLPTHVDVIALFKKYNVGKIRLFDPVVEALDALKGSGIDVTIGIPNQDLPKLASSVAETKLWFDTYVEPYTDDVRFAYIAAGNEVIPGQFDGYVLPVMQNLRSVFTQYQYTGIRPTTVIATCTLGASFPPSAGAFSDATTSTMSTILEFMSTVSSPLLVNAYPFFAYASDPTNIRLDYALLNATEPIVKDGNLSYTNMLDAVLDAFHFAMERLGVKDVDLVVSESGWPSAGNGNFTTPELAGIYNRNFVKKFSDKCGTPKRPNSYIEGFVFAMFNENLKSAGVEQNFGLFYPDTTPVYPVFT